LSHDPNNICILDYQAIHKRGEALKHVLSQTSDAQQALISRLRKHVPEVREQANRIAASQQDMKKRVSQVWDVWMGEVSISYSMSYHVITYSMSGWERFQSHIPCHIIS